MSANDVADETARPFELPPELAIDTAVARRVIAGFIRGQLRQAGFERLVLGLSGGIDSALVAYLVVEAIGAENLLCVLMPYRTSSPASRSDAEAVVAALGTASVLVDISPMVDAYFADRPDASALRRGNFMARQRMAVLYDHSVTFGGLVVGTGNKTESLIGYTTLFGDSACAFNPIGDLYKSQVRQLAIAMGVPETVVRKAPSADLWPGQTDESEGEFDYSALDRLLFWRVDKRRSTEELVALGFDPATIERVDADDRRVRVQAPGATDRQARPAHGRRRLPVPAPAPGFDPGVNDATGADGGTGLGTLYVVATPIGNLGDITLRAIETLRTVPLIAAEDTRLTHRLLARHGIVTPMTSYHARSGPARTAALLSHLRGGFDLALVTDAGTPAVSDPGGELVAAWAREGGTVVPLPGASAVLAAVAGSGVAGPRWAFEGFLPRSGRERRERPGQDRRRRARRRAVRGAGTGHGDPAGPRERLRPRTPGSRVPRTHQDARDVRAWHARRSRASGVRGTDPGARRVRARRRSGRRRSGVRGAGCRGSGPSGGGDGRRRAPRGRGNGAR